jgi:hypothetical protein
MPFFAALTYSENGGSYYTISRLCLFQAGGLLAQHYATYLTTVKTARKCQCRKRSHFIATNMSLFAALTYSENGVSLYTISRLCLFQAGALLAQHYTTCLTTVKTAKKCQCRKRSHFIATNMSLFGALTYSENGVSLYTISRLCLFQAGALLAQHYTTCLTTVKTARKCQCRKRSQFIATNMSLFGALKLSENGGSLYTISRLCLFPAGALLAQHYTTCLTTVKTARKCQCRKRSQFIATNMSLFGALKLSENGGSLYTISRLCLFQAGALLAQHYTTCLTTVKTARKCQCRKRSHFIATNMSLFGALTYSENGGSLYTIPRLCLFQAGALLAQHYTTCLTTVNIARKCQCRKRSHFIATNMSLFAALKSSGNGSTLYTISRLCLFQANALLAQHYTTCLTTVSTARKCQYTNMSLFAALTYSENGGSLYTISRLCLFQAGALLAQHYTTCLTTVNSAKKCQCRKRSHFIATNMSLFGALTYSENGVSLYTISRLCLFQAGALLAQHYTTCLTTVKTARKCQCRKRSQFIATNMSLFGALTYSENGGSLYTISRLCLFQAGGLLAQHYTTCLTTVKTARKCQCRKRSQFIATNMSLFGALKLSENGGSLYTISRLCLFQAGALLAQHYTTCLTTVKTARKCQCRKRSHFIATNMSLFGALKLSENGVSLYTISRLCLFQAGGLLAQHYTTYLTTVNTARKCQCRKRSHSIY